jgi:hypothetical protein
MLANEVQPPVGHLILDRSLEQIAFLEKDEVETRIADRDEFGKISARHATSEGRNITTEEEAWGGISTLARAEK